LPACFPSVCTLRVSFSLVFLCVGGILYRHILSSISSKMRFRRSSTVEDEDSGKKSSPIRLPMMRRNRHSVQESKENIPPDSTIDAHDSASSSPKASRRRTMIDFFKHKPGPKVEEESENGLTRMSTQRTKSVSLQSTAGRQT
jgi:hypothetical protein